MRRSEHRILTTHVGSLIRPKALLERKDRAAGSAEQELRQAVADIVARQAAAGIDIVNDGEFGKSGWANYVLERVTGFEPRPDTLYPRSGSAATAPASPTSWRWSFRAA
jgi:5-methyltetrahydropteroyltriglutamate--homocysteine methyltransferase